MGSGIDIRSLSKWVIVGFIATLIYIAVKIDSGSAIVLLIMGVFAIIGIMIFLGSRGLLKTKPLGQIIKIDHDNPRPFRPRPEPPLPAAPKPEPEPEPARPAQKTFCVAVEGNHEGTARFRKIFGERLEQWTQMKAVKEDQKNRAHVVVWFKVQRQIQRTGNIFTFAYTVWSAETQGTVYNDELVLREVDYKNDEVKLFEGAAFKIASALTQKHPDLFH